jgi:hypothetical protein
MEEEFVNKGRDLVLQVPSLCDVPQFHPTRLGRSPTHCMWMPFFAVFRQAHPGA